MQANKNHLAFKAALEKLIAQFSGLISDREMLAVSAQVTGMLVALQDQNTTTVDKAMTIVETNLEIGNKMIIGELMNHTAGTA